MLVSHCHEGKACQVTLKGSEDSGSLEGSLERGNRSGNSVCDLN